MHIFTRKNIRFHCDHHYQEAFEALKEKLTSSRVLALSWDFGEFILDTDASEHAVGAVLSQVHDGEEKIIWYFSRLYREAERNYYTTRKELLAVVE